MSFALLLSPRPATAQPRNQAHCRLAEYFLTNDRKTSAEVERDTIDDWRTGRKHPGCRVTAAGVTTRGLAGEAVVFYERLRASGWTRTPDPRDAPNEASLRFRRGGSDCLFNVYGDALLFTDAEQRVAEARQPGPGETRYGVFVICMAALPASKG
jgi:hypothetical protein